MMQENKIQMMLPGTTPFLKRILKKLRGGRKKSQGLYLIRISLTTKSSNWIKILWISNQSEIKESLITHPIPVSWRIKLIWRKRQLFQIIWTPKLGEIKPTSMKLILRQSSRQRWLTDRGWRSKKRGNQRRRTNLSIGSRWRPQTTMRFPQAGLIFKTRDMT